MTLYAYAIVAVIMWVVASIRIQRWWEREFTATPPKDMRPSSLLFGLVAAFLWPLYAFWLVLVAIGWAWERVES